MKVLIINGYPGSGKDEFCNILSKKYNIINISSVDKIKEVAYMLGWDGKKNTENRHMLSTLKELAIKCFDTPFNEIIKCIIENNDKDFICVHIREPKEIKRIKNYCVDNNIICNAVFIDRGFKFNYNMSNSDKLVELYSYDVYLRNKGSLEDYNNTILTFALTL